MGTLELHKGINLEILHRRRPQGALVYAGKKRDFKTKFSIVGFNQGHLEKEHLDNIHDLLEAGKKYSHFWAHITGLEDKENLEIIGQTYKIHQRILQNTLDTLRSAKVVHLDEHLNVTFKDLEFDTENQILEKEHLSIIVGEKNIFSFSEKNFECFEATVQRMEYVLKNNQVLPMDRILFILLDVIEDRYTEVLEEFEKRISRFELEVFSNRTNINIERIYKFKRQELRARKSLLPAREVVSVLMKQPNDFVSTEVAHYFKDLHDHLGQMSDAFENLRETLNSVIDIALSKDAEKTNHVMKILTILSTIFLPLNFIAGVFGMNFTKMPLLANDYGFWIVVLFMLLLSAASLILFFRKKWL